MKEIKLDRLTLVNFKGIRSLTVDFDEYETNIYGANATGKTTVFDAFRWVLFGKDSLDRKDFNIKTLGADGKPIERLPHSVTAELTVDGESVTLTKNYVEKWTKKRGSAEEVFTGNGVECFYNDVPMTARDYEAKVSAICDEQVFKLITNPLYFTSLKKDAQRAMLIDLAGDVTNEELAAENPDFADLVGMLSGKTIEELKREVANRKRKVREGIDTIPARIDERQRSMPEARDWAALEKNISVQEYEIKHIDAQLADISKAYGEATKHKQDVARRLSEAKGRIASRRYGLKDSLLAAYNDALRDHNAAQQRASQLRNDRRVKAIALPRLQSELKALQEKRESLLEEWRTIRALEFTEPDREDFVCPTCHRPLDECDIEAKTEELRTAFNDDKLRRLEHNKTVGTETKSAIEAKQAEIKAIEDECFRLDSDIAETENSAAYKETPEAPDVEPAISADETLRALTAEAEALQQELDKEVPAPDTAKLQDLKRQYQNSIEESKTALRDREAIAAGNRRIAELENEYRAGQAELARLEGTEYTIAQFCKARIEHVESRINGMFSTVRFRMYEQQINGGEVETCEATVDGVPYSDLNSAAKINAGLDIINAICTARGITAPIFIDNRESVSDIITTCGQVINLVVDDNCKTLKIR